MNYAKNYAKIKNFKSNQMKEKQVSDFLDENFYSVISTMIYFKRSSSTYDQYAGIDLSVGSWLVDEKVKNSTTPNRINNYWASVEIHQKNRLGYYVKGWFTADDIKTTHYSYLYDFEDVQNTTSCVINVFFSKNELKELVEREYGLQEIIKHSEGMEHAQKYKDDKILKRKSGKTWKLTKSYEGATVLCTTLEDLTSLKGTRIIKIIKGKISRISFDELREMFK